MVINRSVSHTTSLIGSVRHRLHSQARVTCCSSLSCKHVCMKDVFTWTRVWITRVRVNKNQFWLIDFILLNTCLTHVFNSGKHVFNTHVHVNACLTRAFRWTSVWHTRSSERVFHTRVQINACLTRVFRQTRFRQNVHNTCTICQSQINEQAC